MLHSGNDGSVSCTQNIKSCHSPTMSISKKPSKYFFRRLKKRIANIFSRPISYRTEKIGLLFNVLLTFIATALAFITLNQQQSIKGMTDLLNKQDISIKKQTILIDTLARLSIQNQKLIFELETSNRLLREQLKAILYQTENSRISSKPLITVQGHIM